MRAGGSGLLALAVCAGCVGHLSAGLNEDVAPPGSLWVPPPDATPAAPALPATAAAASLSAHGEVTLAQLVDYALSHNPRTDTAYAQARAAAAGVGSAKAAWYPSLDLEATASYSSQTVGGGAATYQSASVGPSATLSWLVLDLGGRSAAVDRARSVLYAANFSYNAALQDVILEVEQTYYQALAARALVEAATASLAEAQRSVSAAEARQKNGLATVADVLAARTAAAEATIALNNATGDAAIFAGRLAAAIGVRADTALAIGELAADIPVTSLTRKVAQLIAGAEAQRPDLAAARAQAEAAGHQVDVARARSRPTLGLDVRAGRSYFIDGKEAYGDSVAASLVLRFPLFTGFGNEYDEIRARAEHRAAQASAAELAHQVALDVWVSFHTVQTSAATWTASRDLLAAAEASQKAAAGRYEAGVGTLIELLNAQSALASARGQEVSARAGWLVAMAALAHATGKLGPHPSEAQP
ncbi:MAG TPA: TolC family protein [Kofleriaceae bacterium]|nr:TolC family protein [Kofleriaceae bacterium]